MTSVLFNSILLILSVSISINQSKFIEKSPPTTIGYESDYEIQAKNSNGKSYIAYIIEEGDIIMKKKCTCISRNKCDVKNSIKLSK